MGMTIFSLATQSIPFNDLQLHRAMNAAQKGIRPSRPLSLGGERLDSQQKDSLWALINVMWDHRPENRPDASNVAEKIDRISELVPMIENIEIIAKRAYSPSNCSVSDSDALPAQKVSLIRL